MKMTHIQIPDQFNRNAADVRAQGVENTGLNLINYANELLGYSDLSDKEVLDIGCGVRFTQTIINRDIPVKKYTGIEIDRLLINYLTDHVQDDRFFFGYWHIYNELYNPTGEKLTKRTKLPLLQNKKFDAIWMFSVITHNNPADAECLFHILRKYIKKDGFMLFSAFIDNNIDTFQDGVKDQPLFKAYYNQNFMRQILSNTGWEIKSAYDKRPGKPIQHHFVCAPKRRFWTIFGK